MLQNGFSSWPPWTGKDSDHDNHIDDDDYEDDDDCNSMCRMGLLGLARPLTHHHLPMFLGDNKDSRTHCVPISYNFSVSASTRSNELSA